MKKALLCALVAVAAMNPVPGVAGEPVCELQRYASLPVRLDLGGAVLVPVKIGDEDVWMRLAMSEGIARISEAFAVRLDLPVRASKGLRLRDRDGNPRDQVARMPRFSLGGAVFEGWEFFVFPELDGEPTYAGLPIVGSIGSNLLRSVDVELNLGERNISLFRRTLCGARAVYWGGTYTAVKMHDDGAGTIVFAMELEGQRIETAFNTGSRMSRISEEVTRKYFGFDAGSEGILREPGVVGEVASYRPMSLTAKGLDVREAAIRLMPPHNRCSITARAPFTQAIGYGKCSNVVPFSLGTDLLKHLRVYIASREQEIYFTRARPAAGKAAAVPEP